MMKRMHVTLLGAVVITADVAMAFSGPHQITPAAADDKEEIVNHIHGIFNAYMQQDEPAIRAMHTADWTGFKSGSRSIVRGIEGYMRGGQLCISDDVL